MAEIRVWVLVNGNASTVAITKNEARDLLRRLPNAEIDVLIRQHPPAALEYGQTPDTRYPLMILGDY